MRKATLLFADNAEDFLNSRKEFLEKDGYRILVATTTETSRQVFQECHIDLAILDVRLKNDNDKKDISGIALARELALSVPTIILTDHATVDIARKALGMTDTGSPPAVALVKKEEGNGALLRAVQSALLRNVFIVHGRNMEVLDTIELHLRRLHLRPIILRQQMDRGRTVIEKFEDSSDAIAFAVVLLTPDDVGGLRRGGKTQPRARQNVLVELGYFVGKLGRRKVCVLSRGNVEIPSDYYGVLSTPMDAGDRWKTKLEDEMTRAGLIIVRPEAR